MHEMGIATAALEQVLAQATKAGGSRVHRICVRVGSLSGVDPEALRFAFSVVLPGTSAAGAVLDIEPVQAAVRCDACERHFEPVSATLFECPDCHAFSSSLLRGLELDLHAIDIS